MHCILIDHENVQPADLAGFDTENVTVLVFTGNTQKVAISLIEAVQALGERGRFIRITGNGKNALDFHIAYYLGRYCERDPLASFLLVSMDTGYDPLINHLKASGIQAKRITPPTKTPETKAKPTNSSEKPAAIIVPEEKPLKLTVEPALKTLVKKSSASPKVPVKSLASDADKVAIMLAGMRKNLPNSEASLHRMVGTWLSKESPRIVTAITELKKRGIIVFVNKKPTYKLPKA